MRFQTELFIDNRDRFVTVDFVYCDKNIVVNILTDKGEAVALADLSGPEQQNLLEEIGYWQKRVEKYRAGAYAFQSPPVNHTRWGESEWIRYIEKNGTWLGDFTP